MNKNQQEILDNLLIAIKQDQWNLYWENLVKLLPNINRIDTLNIVLKQICMFLVDFSHTHPEDEEIHKSIEAFNDITSLEALGKQGQLTDTLLEKYWDWPGVSNFRNAFKGIVKPEQYFDHSGEFVDTVVSILSSLFVAIEANNYWAGNPEYPKMFFGTDIRRAVFMLAEHHSD